MARFPTEPLRLWNKAKELRQEYYRNYAQAHDQGGLRYAGGAWTLDAVPAGLGDDVYPLTGEPYGAACAHDREFSQRCLEAAASQGHARDLCAYLRNYWGSIILDQYAFGGPFPRPDFVWQGHICCSHAKWYQVAAELEQGTPMFCLDLAVGPAEPWGSLSPHKIDYVAGQILDGIDWLQETTGRAYDDGKFIEACWNHFRSTHTWARICMLNRAVPAPLDEKSMYSLYVLATLQKSWSKVADFYDELLEEMEDRVRRGIAAVAHERARVMSDTQPPWSFLGVFRYLEKYGVVSLGSLYTFGLQGMWDHDPVRGELTPRPLPRHKPVSREQAARMLADWHLRNPEFQHFYSPEFKSQMMLAICRHWKLSGVMLHYNRGCEGLSLGIAENRAALERAGFPVMAFDGNMGDEGQFDPQGAMQRIDAFMRTLGLAKLA